ncbi:hypothetical protein LDENG_00143970 [Lucifuga dentata]|nr:hypothetical protein LDENG_00143970 [Lucifuga dentata]
MLTKHIKGHFVPEKALGRLTDPPSPEEDNSSNQWVLGDNGALTAKLANTSVYQPPSLKVVQRMAQAHLCSSGMGSVEKEAHSSCEEEEKDKEESNHTSSAKDPPEERRPIRDQSTLLDRLAGSANLSRHLRDKEEAKGREEGKGE